eukprot:c20042_g1_i4.p1 GENE.c20042_g1_i4~~c20042_g1_i4.p1  ORF type:complete len:460 (+),score=205.89 c20042_g1_i4:62-1441(+)
MAEILKTENGAMLNHALLTLQNLAECEENKEALVEECGVVEPLMNVIKTNSAIRSKKYAISVLQMLPVNENIVDEVLGEVFQALGLPKWRKAANNDLETSNVEIPSEEKEDKDEIIIAQMARHRKNVIKEMASSEAVYVAGLQNIKIHFEEPLKTVKDAAKLNIPKIFHLLPPIRKTHETLLSDLENIINNVPEPNWSTEVASTLIRMTPFLKQCSPYIEGFDKTMELLDGLQKNKNAVKVLEKAKENCTLNLQSYLITPIQRIPRLELMLKDIIRHTPSESPDLKILKEAVNEITSVAAHCNQRKKDADTRYRLAAIALKIKNIPTEIDIMSKTRDYVHEGTLKIYPPSVGPMYFAHFYLFTDLLIWATNDEFDQGGSQHYSGHLAWKKRQLVIGRVSQEEMKQLQLRTNRSARRLVSSVPNESLMFTLENGTTSRVLCAPSEVVKQEWINRLKEAQK